MPKKVSKKGRTHSKQSSENGPQDTPTGRQQGPLGEHLGPGPAKTAPGRELGTINGAKDLQKTPRGRPEAPPGRLETQFV